MPAAKNTTVKSLPSEGILKVGMLVNLERGGRTYEAYKILAMDDRGILFLGNDRNAPQTEKVFIPWHDLNGVGIVSE